MSEVLVDLIEPYVEYADTYEAYYNVPRKLDKVLR